MNLDKTQQHQGLAPKTLDRTFSIAPMLDWTDFIVFSGL